MGRKTFVYGVRKVRRMGRRHGRGWRWEFPFRKVPKDPQPPAGQTAPAEYEEEIRGAAASHLEDIAQQWQREDERLARDLVGALGEHVEAEKSLKKEAAEADEAVREYTAARGVVNALGLPDISGRTRTVWLVVLAILEFPINRVVFEIFQTNWIETTLAAGVVAVAIPLLAHLTGYTLRQDFKNKRDTALLIVGVAGAVGLIGAVAYVRSLFLEGENQLDVLGIHLDPNTMTLVFIIVNISIYLVALIVSYHGSHPQGRVFRQAFNRLKAAQRSLKKESGEAQVARRRLEAASKAVDLARVRRQKRFESLAEEARSIITSYDHLVRVYRMANQEARPPGTRPPCFSVDPPPVPLPQVLVALREVQWDPAPATGASSPGAAAQASPGVSGPGER